METELINDSPIHHWVKNLASPPLNTGYRYWLCRSNSTQWELTTTRMHMHAQHKACNIQIRNMISQHHSIHSPHHQQHNINHAYTTLITTHGDRKSTRL